MHWSKVSLALLAGAVSSASAAASAWGFQDGVVSVSARSEKVSKENLSPSSTLQKPITLGSADTLKVVLTTTEGKKAKRAHQVFLTLEDTESGLAESFLFSGKESGKASVSVPFKDIPLALSSLPTLTAKLTIASFGSSTPYTRPAFTLTLSPDASAPRPKPEEAVRYTSKPEIHHIFRAEPRSPPKIITLLFTALVLAALPALLISWAVLGANVSHLGKALNAAPASHALFVGSVLAMEGVFFLYYTSWNLFQTLPVAGVVGAVAFLSGSRALGEVQARRLAGER